MTYIYLIKSLNIVVFLKHGTNLVFPLSLILQLVCEGWRLYSCRREVLRDLHVEEKTLHCPHPVDAGRVSPHPLCLGGRVVIPTLLRFLLKGRPWPFPPHSLSSPSLQAEVPTRLTWVPFAKRTRLATCLPLEISFNQRTVSWVNASMSVSKRNYLPFYKKNIFNEIKN